MWYSVFGGAMPLERIEGMVRVYEMPVGGALCPTGEIINGLEDEVRLDLQPEETVFWGRNKKAVVRSFIRNGSTRYLLVSELSALENQVPVRPTRLPAKGGNRGRSIRTDRA